MHTIITDQNRNLDLLFLDEVISHFSHGFGELQWICHKNDIEYRLELTSIKNKLRFNFKKLKFERIYKFKTQLFENNYLKERAIHLLHRNVFSGNWEVQKYLIVSY